MPDEAEPLRPLTPEEAAFVAKLEAKLTARFGNRRGLTPELLTEILEVCRSMLAIAPQLVDRRDEDAD